MIDIIVRVFNTEYPNASCKALALAIARRCGSEKGLCWANHETLGRDAQLGRSTIFRCLKQMEAHTIDGVSYPLVRRWKRARRADGRPRSDLMAPRCPPLA